MNFTNRLGVFAALGFGLLVACSSEEDGSTPQLRTGASNGSAATGTGASSSGGGNVGLSGGGASTDEQAKSCTVPSDCDDHNECTTDTCVHEGEFAHCENKLTNTSGTCASEGNVIDPIDPACASSDNPPSVFPPFVPLKAPDVPATCKNGFELNQAKASSVYTLTSKTAQGSRAITLDVDFATYLVPDGMTITGVDGNGQTYTLLDTCRLQTWTAGDPTKGAARPPDETIRQFHIDVRAGTKQLKVTFGLTVSPMYVRILGLCDFNVTQFTSAGRWVAVP